MIISHYSDKKTLPMIVFVSFSAIFRLDTRSVNPSAGPKLSLFLPDRLMRGTPNCLVCSTLQKLLSIKKPVQRYSLSLPPDSSCRGTTTTDFSNYSITYYRRFVNISGPSSCPRKSSTGGRLKQVRHPGDGEYQNITRICLF
jgi:hypothetical protein